MEACRTAIPVEDSAGSGRDPTPFEPLPGSDLPLFRSDTADPAGGETWYYVPGYLVLVARERSAAFEADLLSAAATEPHAVELRDRAQTARRQWTEMLTRPFAPVCLTVYPSNRCNSACSYCYSFLGPRAPGRLAAEPRVALAAVEAAADVVAANCRARSLPLTLVLHGGGEPTLDRRLVESILRVVEASARRTGLVPFRYVATNGIMPESRAAWLADRFDLIGLSCDGPEWINARQRPLLSGRSGTPVLERTARIVREAGRPLDVRVTLTPESFRHQMQIAEYICNRLRPHEIHVEPLYRLGRGVAAEQGGFASGQAEAYVACFLEARAEARRHGIDWISSAVRPGEIHGPHCQLFKDVLQVVPGGVAAACFGAVGAAQARQLGLEIGSWQPRPPHFAVDEARVWSLRRILSSESSSCRHCFNRYHCARDCPESCPAGSPGPSNSFRCRTQLLLAHAYLRETAVRLRAGGAPAQGVLGGPIGMGIDPEAAA